MYSQSFLTKPKIIVFLVVGVFFLPQLSLSQDEIGSSEKGILKEQWRYPLHHYYEWGWFGSSSQ